VITRRLAGARLVDAEITPSGETWRSFFLPWGSAAKFAALLIRWRTALHSHSGVGGAFRRTGKKFVEEKAFRGAAIPLCMVR